jgi:DNA-binding NtrC family response regulator
MTGRRRILVVDDEPEVLDVLRDFVEHLGYEASAAASGEHAIAAMATGRPHVVLLDLMLPGISGLEVLNYLGKHHPTVPVIVITGNSDQKIAGKAHAAGAFEVVGKPFDFKTLRGLVAQATRLASGT